MKNNGFSSMEVASTEVVQSRQNSRLTERVTDGTAEGAGVLLRLEPQSGNG